MVGKQFRIQKGHEMIFFWLFVAVVVIDFLLFKGSIQEQEDERGGPGIPSPLPLRG
jgi:hypothetical protein